jgi:hypothetical protein
VEEDIIRGLFHHISVYIYYSIVKLVQRNRLRLRVYIILPDQYYCRLSARRHYYSFRVKGFREMVVVVVVVE